MRFDWMRSNGKTYEWAFAVRLMLSSAANIGALIETAMPNGLFSHKSMVLLPEIICPVQILGGMETTVNDTSDHSFDRCARIQRLLTLLRTNECYRVRCVI